MWWLTLSGTRQAGMAANPITFLELEAFERKTLVTLTAWQTDLIMRLDRAVLAVLMGDVPKPKPKPDEPAEIPVTNTEGLRAMFRGIAARKRREAKRQQTGAAPRKGGRHG